MSKVKDVQFIESFEIVFLMMADYKDVKPVMQ